VMGIPVIEGREFTTSDDEIAAPAAIVNETTAALLWPGQSASGKSIRWSDRDWAVVGVVRDAVYHEVGETPQTQVYLSYPQNPSLVPTFVIVVTGEPLDVGRSVADVIRAYDPGVLVYRTTTLSDVVRQQLGQYRVLATWVSASGGLALLLAVMGLYGVQSYLVSQRRREIGIRMALGAASGAVTRAIIERGALLALVGIVAGLGAAFASARMLESMLFGIRARDPLTFVSASLILLCVALAATLIPAIRAARVDPAETLKEE